MSATAPTTAPELLSPDHEIDEFDSGAEALDVWLKRRARPNEVSGATRTFVICSGKRVVGYYSLAAASIMPSVATGKTRRNMPDPVPAVLIGRLAIDRAWQGQRLGIALLRDAVLRVTGAAQTVGVRAILVHALTQDAKAFYERFGFRASPLEPMTLMLTVDEIDRALGRLSR